MTTIFRCTMFLIVLLLSFLCKASAVPLEIAVEDSAPPWSQKDGTGYANDVVKSAFKAVGVEIAFKVVPYARCKYMAMEGLAVACFSSSADPELQKAVTFSDSPLFIVHADYFQDLAKPLNAATEDALPPGIVIGTVRGYEYPDSVTKLKANGVIFQEAKDEETNLKKLALGRIDAALINHNDIKPASVMIKNAGVAGKVGFAFQSGDMGSFIGFSKKHPLGEFARDKFNQGFRLIKRNGTLSRIDAQWAVSLPEK